MTPGRYRKRPVVIEAAQLGVDYDRDCEIVRWCGGEATGEHGALLAIYTLEGRMLAGPGDWIIKGVQGEFYPCKPDIFEATYEPAAGCETLGRERRAHLRTTGVSLSSQRRDT